MKRCKAEYYTRIINENKQNYSALWKTLNEVTSRKQNGPVSCIGSDGVIFYDQKCIASIMNQYFSSVATKLVEKLKAGENIFVASDLSNISTSSTTSFRFMPVTEKFVLNELKRLKTNMAIELDLISARLLKDSATVIYKRLTVLFNRSLDGGIYPTIWKHGRVVALFKSGDRTDCNNYRPITILPTISKILERAVHQQLYTYLEEQNILTSKQFGFRPRLSTVTALMHFTDTILQNLDNGSMTGVVFLDLTKAFDTVDYDLLLRKLRAIGVDAQALRWLHSYHMNRQVVTLIRSTQSACCEVPVGVPQGSIYGPLLFIVFVNDLPSAL